MFPIFLLCTQQMHHHTLWQLQCTWPYHFHAVQHSTTPRQHYTRWLWCLHKVQHTIAKLQPIALQFVHVKGHQDRQKQQHLLLEAQLNIESNQQASAYLSVACTTKPQPNPALINRYPSSDPWHNQCPWNPRKLTTHCNNSRLLWIHVEET